MVRAFLSISQWELQEQPISNPFIEDIAVLTSARKQARSTFLANRSLAPESPESIAAIAHAEDVAQFLRRNVVQGQKAEGDEKYSRTKSSHDGEMKIKLTDHRIKHSRRYRTRR